MFRKRKLNLVLRGFFVCDGLPGGARVFAVRTHEYELYSMPVNRKPDEAWTVHTNQGIGTTHYSPNPIIFDARRSLFVANSGYFMW